jgi:hypothetical protein
MYVEIHFLGGDVTPEFLRKVRDLFSEVGDKLHITVEPTAPLAEDDWAFSGRPASESEIANMVSECEEEYRSGMGYTAEEVVNDFLNDRNPNKPLTAEDWVRPGRPATDAELRQLVEDMENDGPAEDLDVVFNRIEKVLASR